MELQWPLILFTTLVAWSAGLFASQCALALTKEGKKAQFAAWITAAALLVAGGIAVFFHLQHWERIFNGFGNPTSGITQELIMIVVLAVVAIIYLVLMRRSDDGATVPKWIAIVGIVVSAILVAVMAHSYMMAARPAWNSVFWILAVLGNACVLGPATLALICGLRDDDLACAGKMTFWGSIINAVTSVAYAIAMQVSGASFIDMGYYYNPTHPTYGMTDISAVTNVFAGDSALLVWLGIIVIGAAVPAILAIFAGKRGNAATWKWCGAVIAVSALIGAVCMRVVFYNVGLSVFCMY